MEKLKSVIDVPIREIWNCDLLAELDKARVAMNNYGMENKTSFFFAMPATSSDCEKQTISLSSLIRSHMARNVTFANVLSTKYGRTTALMAWQVCIFAYFATAIP